MPFNGTGTFNRLFNWQQDRDNDVDVLAVRMDAEMDGFADGLTNCLTKDGQNQATQDQPMGGNRHTGVANATAPNHYAGAGQVQSDSMNWGGTAGGTADALTLTLVPPISAYAAGQRFRFRGNASNTGAATINIDGVGDVALTADGVALEAGYIVQNGIYEATYIGPGFQIRRIDNQPPVQVPLLPRVTDVVNLGSADLRYANLFANALNINGAVDLNGVSTFAGVVTVYTGNATLTKADIPVHITHIHVWVWGGGGGGGGGNTTGGSLLRGAGAGGGGGGAAYKRIPVADLADNENIVVGLGGTGGNNGSPGSSGQAGGTSSFGAHVSATGGGGGSFAGGAGANGGGGGQGVGGTFNRTGQSGGLASYSVAVGQNVFGFGGDAPMGGGAGGIANVGTNGAVPGAGASGGNHIGGKGGDGGRGEIIIAW